MWKRERRLGQGGFGTVWLERIWPGSSAPYEVRAVKELRIRAGKEDGKSYARELEALAKFSQVKFADSFVGFYGWFESPGALYIAMEYCEYGDLAQYLDEHGPLSENEAQQVTGQILEGLTYLHENKFAHRDLKPGNILIKKKPPESEWHVKICDMGLSKRVHDQTSTRTIIIGTLGFMPPELLPGFSSGDNVPDPFAADMWSFGETTFQLLTKQGVFSSMLQLRNYVHASIAFPSKPLETVSASKAAIDFIQSLMLPLPSQRLSASEANKHNWMSTSSLSIHLLSHSLGQQWNSWPSELDTKQVSEPSLAWSQIGISVSEPDQGPLPPSLLKTAEEEQNAKEQCVEQFRGSLEPASANSITAVIVNPLGRHGEQKDLTVSPATPSNPNLAIALKPHEGASISAKDTYGFSPLAIAALQGREDDIRDLIQKGANIELADKVGYTPLWFAVWKSHEGAVRLLVEHKADIESRNDSGESMLARAASRGEVSAVRLLIKYGAAIDSRDNRGWSPLTHAVYYEKEASIKILLDHGANTESKDEDGVSPLGYAATEGKEIAIRSLIKHGANIESKDNVGLSPLTRAAHYGHERAVRILIEHGADIESKAKVGFSPLARAAIQGQEAIVRMLINHGANVDSKDKQGATPLAYAALLGNEVAIRILIQCGANIESKDTDGESPLAYAAEAGNEGAVRLLIEYGADVESTGKHGLTPLALAKRNHHKKVITILRKNGARLSS